MQFSDSPALSSQPSVDDAWFARVTPVRSLGAFTVAAFSFSWITWFIGMALVQPQSIADEGFATFLVIGSFGPTVAAVATLLYLGGWPALAWLLRRWVRVRARWWVWLIVFFTLPVVYAAVLLVIGVRPQIEWWMLAVTIAVVPINAVLVGVLFGVGPLGEESGWRGVLSPALDRRLGRLGAALVVGVVWAAWHAPLATFSDWRGDVDFLLFAVTYPVTLVAFSFAIIWVMRWTRDSLFFAVLFHGVFNLTASLMNDTDLWNLAGASAELLSVAGTVTVLLVAVGCELVGRSGASHRAIAAHAARAAARQQSAT